MGNIVTIFKKLLCLESREPIDLLLDDFESRSCAPTRLPSLVSASAHERGRLRAGAEPPRSHPLVIEHVEFKDKRKFKYVPRYVYSRKNIKFYKDGTKYCETDYPYTQSEIR